MYDKQASIVLIAIAVGTIIFAIAGNIMSRRADLNPRPKQRRRPVAGRPAAGRPAAR